MFTFGDVNFGQVSSISLKCAIVQAIELQDYPHYVEAFEWATAHDERDYAWATDLVADLAEGSIVRMNEKFMNHIIAALRCVQTVCKRYEVIRIEAEREAAFLAAVAAATERKAVKTNSQRKKAAARAAAKARRLMPVEQPRKSNKK